jgi:hypothetical protein
VLREQDADISAPVSALRTSKRIPRACHCRRSSSVTYLASAASYSLDPAYRFTRIGSVERIVFSTLGGKG